MSSQLSVMTQLQQHELETQLQEHELDNYTEQEEERCRRLTESRDKGLISNEYYQKFLYESGRLANPPKWPRMAELRLRRMQRADASDEQLEVLLGLQPEEGKTPKVKKVRKVSACTPQPGMKEARIRAGLSACSKHPNGQMRSYL